MISCAFLSSAQSKPLANLMSEEFEFMRNELLPPRKQHKI